MSSNIGENSATATAANNASSSEQNENKSKSVSVGEDESNPSSIDSSSSNEKLKIDVSDNEVVTKKPQQQQNGGSTTTTTTKSSKESNNAKSDELALKPPAAATTTTVKETEDKESNSSSKKDNKTPTSSSKKRRVDRGLDGGYWARMSLDSAAANNNNNNSSNVAASTSTSSPQSSRKRRRTATERLDLSSYTKLPHHLSSSSMYLDVDSADSDARGNDTSDGDEMNTSIHSESTVGSKSTPTAAAAAAAATTSSKDRFTLFKTKSFLAVLSDEGGFYLCQATHAIYEDSKRCKIQWLEEAGENLYKMGYVDWIDPATIVARVKVRRRKEDHLLQIDKPDLDKVNGLVEKALKEGGITVDFDKEGKGGGGGEKKKGASKSNKDILNDEELYEKETSDRDQEDLKKKDKKEEKEGKEAKVSSEKKVVEKPVTKPVEVKSTTTSSKPLNESVKPKPQKPPEKASTENKEKEKEKEKKPAEAAKIIKSSPNGEKLQKKTKIIESEDSEEELPKKKKVSIDKVAVKKVVAKKSINDEDTDELESDSEKQQPQSRDPRTKPKQSPKQPAAQQQTQKTAPQSAEAAQPATTTAADGSLQVKKRRLDKAISNRHLQENTRVEVYLKDPFFEQDVDVPFVSPSAHSKLVFRAIYLNDMRLLKSLIDDVDRVLSVHIGRSVGANETPSQYALQLGNKRALEMLLDDFVKGGNKKRVQMPETMLYRFSNGAYNPRSMGGLPFIRRLTESRGAKEGNQALTKDHSLLEFCTTKDSYYQSKSYFKRLFERAFEIGCSTETFDFIMSKYNNSDNSNDTRFVYELVYRAILFGHRHLAAHVISSNAALHGFNSVHIEVLKADSDQELKCQLRAQMCTKKPYANDYITPIHCASINPNVKYLKTLLSITQDFNISDRRGRRPVHFAAVCEGPTPLEYLISRVSPYDLDSDGNTPLHLACQAGRSINVEILLNNAQTKLEDDNALTTDSEIHNKYGLGGINKPNRRAKLPLHLAISKNNYDCIKVLLKYGCNVEYPLPNSMDKITPLMYACQMGHQKLVKLLVENNAKVTARDRFWRTATMHAAMCGQTSILSYLLRLGADPNTADSSGNTSLHYACAYGWYHAVKVLIEAGARVNAANDWKLTPFGAAFLKGHVGICDQLLQSHPNQIDVNFRTDDGETLVMLAVSSSNVLNEASASQLDYIINKLGGNATLVDSRGNNAFHYLASNRLERQQLEQAFPECDKAALELKVNEQEQLRLRMAECLLKAKCSPTLANNDMETPLIRALNCLNVRFARYLLTMKANKEGAKLEKNFLAVLANKCREMDACAVILGDDYNNYDILNKFKADFERMASQKDENGMTPFQLACTRINTYLSKQVNETDETKSSIPASLSRFVLFLHNECKSNPNEPVYMNNKCSAIENNDDDCDTDASQSSANSCDDKEDTSSSANKINFLPIFKIISNRCVDLIGSLVSQSKNSAAIPIDFNVYDSEGLTPLLDAIVSKEFKFAEKLIDLGLFDDTKLLKNQICKNSSTHLKESVIQLLIRSSQADLLTKTLRLMSTNTKHLIDLLEHQNSYGQNFLHTLSFCSSTSVFTSAYLCSLFKELYSVLTKERATECLPNLLKTKDILGRNPVHFCLLTMGGDSSRSNTDLELFFAEDIYTIVDSARVEQIFTQRDSFDRLPLHYLFYNTFNRTADLELYKTALLKQSSVENGLEKLLKSIKSVELKRDNISSIDPVELLSMIIKQTTSSMSDTNNKTELIDRKDVFGYTPMHYAAIRGSSVCLSLFISSSCDFLSRANDSNTPLSSAIYFKRQSCALTLLRLIETTTSSSVSSTLGDFYYLQVGDQDEDEDDEEEIEERNLKWLGDKEEVDLYKPRRIQLYQLILSYEWEGLSWLVLESLAKYSLTRLDSIRSALAANKFSLALRLIDKLKRDLIFANPTKSPLEAYENLFKQSKSDSNRTLLHSIAQIDFNSLSDKSTVMRILESLFETPTLSKPDHVFNVKYETMLKEFLEARDEFGSTALHYAFYKHNFALIDFIHTFLESKQQVSTILSSFEDLIFAKKDSSGQSAYAISFWQIGRFAYSKKTKESIMKYTLKYLTSPSKLEMVSKAKFPHVNIPNFKSEDSVCGRFIDDYPNRGVATSVEFMISPLLYAIMRQSFDMCKFMIKSLGFDVNTCDSNKISALVYTIRVNNLNLCKLLMNMDYEPDNEKNKPNKQVTTTAAATKGASRMKNLFTTLIPSQQAVRPAKMAKKAGDSDVESDSSDSRDVSSEEDDIEQNGVESVKATVSTATSFKVKTNIILNHVDEKSRTIFHHLACSLDYGSFRNIELARLLFSVFNNNNTEQTTTPKLPQLGEFLKRVDSKVKTASDYALKNGNIELYEEFKRQLNKTATTQLSHTELEKFTVNDVVYNPANKVDYDKDSSSFLHSSSQQTDGGATTTSASAAADKDYFTVDSLSNMHKIGRLVWDKKYNVPYDVILTKTDVSYGLYGIHNFYKIQLITHSYNSGGDEENKQQICVLFTRWGRIGDQGQCQRTPFSSLAEAKDEFAKLFKQKTGNDFVDTVLEKKKTFESKPRRYSLVKLELRRRTKLKDIQFELYDSNTCQSIFNQSVFAKLPYSEHFKQFWTDLLDVDYLKSRIHQSSIISADYIPLTQLSRESIEKAYSILNKSLKPLIERRMELEKLNIKENLMEHMNILEQINKHSNEFYELIPQMNYNYEKLKPIANEAELDAQICALNQLSNAQLACRILMGAKSAMSRMSPFDYVYRAVGCRFELMREADVETQYILKYCMPAGHAQNEQNFTIKRIFKFERPGEQERFDKLQLPNTDNMTKLKNRYLLWHGTSTENLLSIMCKGLRIAPSDALASGARFGKGIYFSDSFEFSHNYTRGRTNKPASRRINKSPATTRTERRNYMLLCEVSLGKTKQLKDETFDTWPPEGYDSVKALGRVEPDPSQSVTLPNGCIVPLGQSIQARLEHGESYYSRSCNEPQYIVYKEAQCCIRYIVQYHSAN